MTVKRVAGSDGLAHIGHINSTNHDFGTVTIWRDLGRIDVGIVNIADRAIKSLAVQLMGRFGQDTQGSTGNLFSSINETPGKLNVREDAVGVAIAITRGTDDNIGSLGIGGSLIGGLSTSPGIIFSEGNIGRVKITRDLRGGSASFSGFITTGGNLAPSPSEWAQ